jgi:hypothetical protein
MPKYQKLQTQSQSTTKNILFIVKDLLLQDVIITYVADPKPTVLDGAMTLKQYGIKNDSVVILKDLGPQIGWKTVFLIEYFGPILIHYLFFYHGDIFYSNGGKPIVHSLPQLFLIINIDVLSS